MVPSKNCLRLSCLEHVGGGEKGEGHGWRGWKGRFHREVSRGADTEPQGTGAGVGFSCPGQPVRGSAGEEGDLNAERRLLGSSRSYPRVGLGAAAEGWQWQRAWREGTCGSCSVISPPPAPPHMSLRHKDCVGLIM